MERGHESKEASRLANPQRATFLIWQVQARGHESKEASRLAALSLVLSVGTQHHLPNMAGTSSRPSHSSSHMIELALLLRRRSSRCVPMRCTSPLSASVGLRAPLVRRVVSPLRTLRASVASPPAACAGAGAAAGAAPAAGKCPPSYVKLAEIISTPRSRQTCMLLAGGDEGFRARLGAAVVFRPTHE